jgi:hypothetical protein
MTAVRRPLIGLIGLFTGALTIDRFALARDGARSVESSAYLLALALVAAALVFRPLRRANAAFIASLAVGGSLVLHVVTEGLLDDPYRALVGTALVALSAVLAHSVAVGLHDVESTLTTVAFGESPAVPLDGREAAGEILAEMARSRRHSRPLSVTVLATDGASVETAAAVAAEEIQQAIRERYVHGRVARTIADQLRRSDLLFEDPATGHFVVVSPETSAEGSRLLVERIRGAVAEIRVRLDAGYAGFPDHALTFEQLVERAQEHMQTGRPAVVREGDAA